MNKLEIYSKALELKESSSAKAILSELIYERDKISPLFNECINKGISMAEKFPEINNYWNNIILMIDKARRI